MGNRLRHLEVETIPGNSSARPFYQCYSICFDVLLTRYKKLESLALNSTFWSAYLNMHLYVEFLKQYCPRLKMLKLVSHGAWKTEHFRVLGEACANTQIEARGKVDADCALALGKSACHLSFSSVLKEKMSRLGEACVNLKSCTCRSENISTDTFRALFNVPKKKLERFKFMASSWAATAPRTILTVLAEAVSTLKECEYDGPMPPALLLEPFVSANASLKKAVFRINSRGTCPCDDCPKENAAVPDVDWSQIVTPFLRSQSLSELDCRCPSHELKYYPDRQNLCAPARARGISVSICGRQYW